MILCIPFPSKLNDAMYSQKLKHHAMYSQKLKHHKMIKVVSSLSCSTYLSEMTAATTFRGRLISGKTTNLVMVVTTVDSKIFQGLLNCLDLIIYK
ncbi:hypothetical protein YC2023_094809 [Brassica napus]